MKLLIIGNGKMGQMLASMASGFEFEVIEIVDAGDNLEAALKKQPDVAIEFTVPAAAAKNVMACIKAGIPVVSGTTGWNSELPQVLEACEKAGGSVIWGSNFSAGVNVWFKLIAQSAVLFSNMPAYQFSMFEKHHAAKIDKPSGTAVTAAEIFCSLHSSVKAWISDEESSSMLPVFSEREGAVVGFHELKVSSIFDQIKISHEAFSRQGFADGALYAAHWLPGQKGFFVFADCFEQIFAFYNKPLICR